MTGKRHPSPQHRTKQPIKRLQQTLTTGNSDDDHLMDDETQQRYGNLSQQQTPMITLDSEKQDDPLTSAIIEYLQTGQLPTDKDLEKTRVVSRSLLLNSEQPVVSFG